MNESQGSSSTLPLKTNVSPTPQASVTLPVESPETSSVRNSLVENSSPPNTQPTTGGSLKKKYKGRSYVVRTGKRGGKYILVKGNKVYV